MAAAEDETDRGRRDDGNRRSTRIPSPDAESAERSARRSNAAWLDDLSGVGEAASRAARELSEILRRSLSRVMRSRHPALELDDLVQESLARVIANLARFRGDAAFTTWAVGIAIRVAFTALRRRDGAKGGPETFAVAARDAALAPCPHTMEPPSALAREDLLRALREAIGTSLSERQRTAILAELRGVPTVEIAERLGTNTNALYKLVHDARCKLKRALVQAGYSESSIHEIASEGR